MPDFSKNYPTSKNIGNSTNSLTETEISENVTKAGVTTDYFKNIIVVKNSPACTLYSK